MKTRYTCIMMVFLIASLHMEGRAQVASIQRTGAGNLGTWNWPAGTWDVRALLIDGSGIPVGSLSPGFTFFSSGTLVPAGTTVTMVMSATPAHTIRVFRKVGTLTPGDTGIQFADYSCNNGGNLAAICDAASSSPIGGGGSGILRNTEFTGVGTVPGCPPANVLYVDAGATGANDGSSWANASPSLQSALASLCPGITQIWVADGTYKPTTGTDRNATFQLVNGIALYGGFNGTETALAQRNVSANITTLSGDIGTVSNNTDNSYHVVTGSGTNATAVLDGFTITAGNANGGTFTGGGMLNVSGSPRVENCTFLANTASSAGGAIYNNGGSPIIRNCTFGSLTFALRNISLGSGGAIHNQAASPTIENSSFIQNTAANNNGGAMDNADGANVLLRDCAFQYNSALRGGGVHVWNATVQLENCSFLENIANFGGGLQANNSSNATAVGCDFTGNWSWGDGGGANIVGNSIGNFRGCRFFGNRAEGNVGQSGGSSPFGGGAVAWFGASGTVVNCTVVANLLNGVNSTDGGGGLMISDSNVDVANSILWSNSAIFGTIEGRQIHVDPAIASTLTVNHSDVEGLSGALGGTGNLGASPLFVNQGTGDLRLKPGSPVIDAGNTAVAGLPATDLDGNPRVSGAAVDMGAYESAFEPVIVSITDIGNDQGRQVRLTFARSSLDAAGSSTPITQYVVFRRIDALPAGSVQAPTPEQLANDNGLEWLATPGWDYIGVVPAFAQTQYSLVMPTLADSTITQGQHWSVFFVRGATSSPALFTNSTPDSGYSLDNLAPNVPQGFQVSGNTQTGNLLTWEPSEDEDFRHYRIYRAATPDVALVPGNVLALTTGTSYMDNVANPGGWYYRLTAVDHAGNESAATGAETPTDSQHSQLPAVTVLRQNHPNPFNPVTRIAFDLASDVVVRLHIYDASGRMVRTLIQGAMPAGRHERIWDGRDDAGRQVASGTYVYKMVGGDYRATRKLVLLK